MMRHFCYSIILILAICFQASARDNSVRDDVAVSGGIKADMAFLNFLTGNAPKQSAHILQERQLEDLPVLISRTGLAYSRNSTSITRGHLSDGKARVV